MQKLAILLILAIFIAGCNQRSIVEFRTENNETAIASEIVKSSTPKEENEILEEETIKEALTQTEPEEFKEILSENTENESMNLSEEIGVGQSEENIYNVSIVVVIDASSSSSETNQRDQVINLLHNLNGKTNVGIIAFNNLAYEIAKISPLDRYRGEFIKKVSELDFEGLSYFNKGIDAGVKMLMEREGSKSMIYFSDGLTTYGKLKEDTRDSARNAGEKGIKIYVVGVGDTVNDELLEDIAALSKGLYFSKDRADELQAIFE